MADSFAQANMRGSFQALAEVYGRTIWVGNPDYQSATAVFESISEIDPDFDGIRDIREACKMRLESPGPSINPGDTVLDGEVPTNPDVRWQVLVASRRNNPNIPILSYVVQKIL